MGHIGTLAVNPSLYPKLSYDPVRDFQLITLVAMIPNMLTLHGPETRAQLAAEAGEPVGNSPEEFGRLIRSEIARWAPVVKQSGAKAE